MIINMRRKILKSSIEGLRSCRSCAYAKEIIMGKRPVKVYCRYIEGFRDFMMFGNFIKDCRYYRPIDCYSCKHKIKMIHKDREKIQDDGCLNHYKYVDVWYLDCEKQGLTEDLRIECGARDICVPSCSLWQWGKHDRT